MAEMTIGGLARAGGVGVETIRYYQRQGLLPEPVRPENGGLGGGVRRYGEADVRALRFIRAAQTAGFTLKEIGRLLALDAADDRPAARELARERIMALDARVAELQAARAALGRLVQDCEAGGPGPCPILGAFEPA